MIPDTLNAIRRIRYNYIRLLTESIILIRNLIITSFVSLLCQSCEFGGSDMF